jgi:hypothetical protein
MDDVALAFPVGIHNPAPPSLLPHRTPDTRAIAVRADILAAINPLTPMKRSINVFPVSGRGPTAN